MMASNTRVWDVFCRVVDNFGDIGVCWRLSRQLADAHAVSVRLWVDDIALAQRFAGAGHPQVLLQAWSAASDFSVAAEVVIETFGCGVPEAYQQAMLARASVWINLDYLSAEDWVEGFHAQPSPQANGLVRHFFYPGLTVRTGGLLREHTLQASQAAAQWQSLGIAPAADDTLNVSLFCYAHAPFKALWDSLQIGGRQTRLLVAETVAPALAQALAMPVLNVGMQVQHQNITLIVVPFLSQDDFDRLLFLCDVNFVRGEDSWIRAIWANKPMIWMPYLQTEDTHLVKLDAFLKHYLHTADTAFSTHVQALMHAWTQAAWQPQHWQTLLALLPTWTAHAVDYAATLTAQPDLVTKLVIFIEKCRIHQV